MRKYSTFLLLAVMLNLLPVNALGGSIDPWAEQFRLPNAAVLWSNGVVFGSCFDTKDYGNKWHYCGDKKNLSSSFVEQKTKAEFQFQVPVKGKLYSVLEAHVDKDAWIAKHVKTYIYKFDSQTNKWVHLAVRTYNAKLKGNTLIYNLPEAQKILQGKIPVNYRQYSDGSITLTALLPDYGPGRYKIILQSADREQWIYVPSEAKCAVYLIPEDPHALSGSKIKTPSIPTTNVGSGQQKTPLGGNNPTISHGDVSLPQFGKYPIESCKSNKAWCYNGGGNLNFEYGYIEIVPENGCSVHLVLKGLYGSVLEGGAPPYQLQMYYRSSLKGEAIGGPFTTDSAGCFNGIIGSCPKGNVLGFVINSKGHDGSFRTFNTGARQQFATDNYYRRTQRLTPSSQ
ncbi:MAG TPA: hypothetical protein PLK94_08325 [Alphaproteobacteria bacterium]|mgnify:FL=1|nr:hypothetical protein [Alphaproteobacteria bacterium]